MPQLSETQREILVSFYQLRREVNSGSRILSSDIDKISGQISYEKDCFKLVIQSIDDHYIELYQKTKLAQTEKIQIPIGQ